MIDAADTEPPGRGRHHMGDRPRARPAPQIALIGKIHPMPPVTQDRDQMGKEIMVAIFGTTPQNRV
ncbi:hypothetical protein NBRC116586_01440 [Pseudooceanicola nitratireducens]